jgi:ribosomal protein L19E
MKTVRNKTPMPLRVQLGGGKTLHLGPAKTGQISDSAAERDSIRKLVEEGKIEFLDGAGTTQSQGGASQGPAQSTHGHPPTTQVTPKGDR